MSFGERLRELRKAAGMTQEKLARAADVSNATVFKLETVKEQDPSWSTVCKLADALGIDVGVFREQVEEVPPAKTNAKAKKGGT